MKKKAVFIVWPDFAEQFLGPDERAQLANLVDLHPEPLTSDAFLERDDLMAETAFLFGAWGMPSLNESTLERLPKLEAVFYAAGSVRSFVTEAFWERGLTLTNASAFNAVPVAEYCAGVIVLSLKNVFRHMRLTREKHEWQEREAATLLGAYGTTVGLISLGMIGRKTLELLQAYHIKIKVYSQSLTAEAAAELGVEKASIEEIFHTSDVVSLHTALTDETRGMITGEHLRSMKQDATFLNTARGAVVRQSEMIEVLQERPDLNAILDVTDPEPPPADDPLFDFPNVFMTPHISGSFGNECRRLGQSAIDECIRYLKGEDQLWPVTRESVARMA